MTSTQSEGTEPGPTNELWTVRSGNRTGQTDKDQRDRFVALEKRQAFSH